MSLTVLDKKNTAAKSLTSFKATAKGHIDVLKSIKTQIAALKSEVVADGDYSVDDQNSVQTVIDELLADIASI
jgi:hypothetical protein